MNPEHSVVLQVQNTTFVVYLFFNRPRFGYICSHMVNLVCFLLMCHLEQNYNV